MSVMSQPTVRGLDAFAHRWSARILTEPPMIGPARQYTYPQQIAGEEDALARGALLVHVDAGSGQGSFLATCALGFRDPTMPSGLFSTPDPAQLCAVAGGYAYLIDTAVPARCVHVPLKPVTAVLPLPGNDLIVFAGFHHLQAYNGEGLMWTSSRLSWDGIQLGEVTATHLHGTGWNMMSDRDVAFTVDLATGEHVGGGYEPGRSGAGAHSARVEG